MKFFRPLLLLALLALSGFAAAAPARANTLTFLMKSEYQYTLRLEFYSTKTGLYWPGNGKSWAMDDYDAHTYKLNCTTGEQICYGAWESGGTLQWGVGYQHSQGCQNCCYTCNGGTTKLIRLTP